MAQYQSITPNQLGQAAVTTTLATLYTTPAATRTFVKDIDIANNTAIPINVTVYLVANGGTAADGSNTLLPNLLVPGYATLQWSGSQVLLPGATIQAIANAVGLSLTASGGEGI